MPGLFGLDQNDCTGPQSALISQYGCLRPSATPLQPQALHAQVADALHFLHAEASLVHCALAPPAVIITAQGSWKLCGLALATRESFSTAEVVSQRFDYSNPAVPLWRQLTQVTHPRCTCVGVNRHSLRLVDSAACSYWCSSYLAGKSTPAANFDASNAAFWAGCASQCLLAGCIHAANLNHHQLTFQGAPAATAGLHSA